MRMWVLCLSLEVTKTHGSSSGSGLEAFGFFFAGLLALGSFSASGSSTGLGLAGSAIGVLGLSELLKREAEISCSSILKGSFFLFMF